MISKLIKAFTVGAFVIGANAIAHAQQSGSAAQSVDVGKYEYDTHCAECHGLGGKGDGPYVQLLRAGTVLPDLTELSKKNDGVFPVKHIVETIDGRVPVRAHGPTDMPIWGQRYKIQSRNVNPDYNPEAFARVKILFLTEYIYRLQAK
jgi:mono/diheme cytochrome c family protein